jgi:hypothetical protein
VAGEEEVDVLRARIKGLRQTVCEQEDIIREKEVEIKLLKLQVDKYATKCNVMEKCSKYQSKAVDVVDRAFMWVQHHESGGAQLKKRRCESREEASTERAESHID